MNDERDDLLDEIARALAVEPSPDFRARVRQRLDVGGGRRLRWFWMGGVAAAAVLAALAIVAQRVPGSAGPERARPTEAARVSDSAPAAARPVSPSPVERADDARVPAARRDAAVSSSSTGLAAAAAGRATAGARPRTRADEAARADVDFAAVLASVQVDPSQLDGLRRIAAAASRRPVAPVVVPPIEIPPIVIASLDVSLVPGVTP